MAYTKQNFAKGQTLKAEHLNNMEAGIFNNDAAITTNAANIAKKQDTLVSGTNIKTINGISILGSGDIVISGGTSTGGTTTTKVLSDDPNLWVRQNISSGGSIISDTSESYNASNIMLLTPISDSITITQDTAVWHAAVFYDSTGKFLSRGSWVSKPGTYTYTPENGGKVNLTIPTATTGTNYTKEEMLAHVTVTGGTTSTGGSTGGNASGGNTGDTTIVAGDDDEARARIDFLAHLQNCAFGGQIAHFSCDDTYACLYDLIQNAGETTEVEGDGGALDYAATPANWKTQSMSSSGSVTTSVTQSNVMHNEKFEEEVTVTVTGGISLMIAQVTYNDDGSFKARSSWTTVAANASHAFSDTNPYHLVIATSATNTSYTVEQMCNNMTVISSTKTNTGTTTETTGGYSSIYENSFFNSLKTIHEATGAVFTLECFNTETTVPDYDISNVPSTFQAEFQAAKSWLKFGFHGENEQSRYASTTGIVDSYNKFVDAIYKLTGDYDCIDRFPRLGFFSGSKENVLAIRDVDHGIIGLLAADDTRVSYYFTTDQNNEYLAKGKFVDVENRLIFIKTMARSWSKGKEEFDGNPCFRKTSEFFWHEYENTKSAPTWITTAANYLKEKGFDFAFPCDIYK